MPDDAAFLKALADLCRRHGSTLNTLPFRLTHLKKSIDGSVRFHEWLESDGRCLHDHAYDSVSVILGGGYWEVTPEGRVYYPAGSVIFRRAETPHRIELDPDKPKPVSLFITGPVRRTWGFHTQEGWIGHGAYDVRRGKTE